MKAKLIRTIPATPYYFTTYEYECIECGRIYQRKRCDNRISPYCGECQRKHDREKQKEYAERKRQTTIDAVLNQIRAKVKDMFQHETQDDYWDGYESCRADVIKIIEKYTKGADK